MKSKIAVVLVATCVVVASCGGDDSGSGGSELSGAVNDALSASLADDSAPFDVTDENISCITGKLLEDEETSTALQDAYDDGKIGEELLNSVDEAESMETKATLMTFQCLSVEQIVEILGSEMNGDAEFTDDQRSCLIDELDELSAEDLANGFAGLAGIIEDDAAAGDLTGALMTCLGTEM